MPDFYFIYLAPLFDPNKCYCLAVLQATSVSPACTIIVWRFVGVFVCVASLV